MTNKNFYLKLKSVAQFIIAIGLFFIGFNTAFNSLFFNIIIFIIGVFFLLQALGNIDTINGYGQHNPNNIDNHNHHNNHHYPNQPNQYEEPPYYNDEIYDNEEPEIDSPDNNENQNLDDLDDYNPEDFIDDIQNVQDYPISTVDDDNINEEIDA